jgi:hypothetical protein
MRVRAIRCLAGAIVLLAAAPALGAGVRANVVPGAGSYDVELLLDYDEFTVDTDAREVVAMQAGLALGQVADAVQALFSAGLVLTWDDQIVSFQSFLFDPASPASFQFTCPETDPGCENFVEIPEPGRMAFGVGLGDFEGILTSGEVLLGTLTFQTVTAGDPTFELGVDEENQFANAPRLRLLDLNTLLGIDLCTGQPVPDASTPPCLDSVSFADVEQVDDLTILTHYIPEPDPSLLAAVATLALVALRRK